MSKLLENVETNLEKRESVSAEQAKNLVQLLFERVPADFLNTFDADTLSAMSMRAFKVLSEMTPDDVRVRVYRPSFDVDGWRSKYVIVETCLRDRPFIVDSVMNEIRRLGYEPQAVLHPIVVVDKVDGQTTIAREGSGQRYSFEMFFLEADSDADLEQLRQRIEVVLRDVCLATDDYHKMQEQVVDISNYIQTLEDKKTKNYDKHLLHECREFLSWLNDGNFVFLGYRDYHLAEVDGKQCLFVDEETPLGILRNLSTSNYRQPVPIEEIHEDLRKRVLGGPLLIVTKSNAEATVHRQVRMDYIGIKRLNEQGEIIGERRLLGLFTSAALNTPVKDIPILRLKLIDVLERDGVVEGSHRYKQIVSIFNSIPREELFWGDPEQLYRDIKTILDMQQATEVRLTFRRDPLARGVLAMVIMPRERFNSKVRYEVQEVLTKAFGADHVDYQLSMGEDDNQVRFHFFMLTNKEIHSVDRAALEREIAEMTRQWSDKLADRIQKVYGAESPGYIKLFGEAFGEEYRAQNSLGTAIFDIRHLDKFEEEADGYRVGIFNPTWESPQGKCSVLRVYHHKGIALSDIMPSLENLGLKALQQTSYVIKPQEKRYVIDSFLVQSRFTGEPIDLELDKERVEFALSSVLRGETANDSLNALVVAAHLGSREVALIKSIQVYYCQILAAFSQRFVTDALLAYPNIAGLLHDFFVTKFQPEVENRKKKIEELEGQFQDALVAVSSLAQDQVLRGLWNVVEAFIRTNYFLDKSYISHKVLCSEIKEMPKPRPMFEIVVVGPHVEGIHLRGGMVARGGLRWSDRPDDFRTEVLGLMKTQMTKNAVIVPVGSKGGFVVKNGPTDRQAFREFGQEQYKVFIRGLLDLTDNIVNGEIVPPTGVLRYDGDDPYLVVAADKGTATFSDTANSISHEYDFWLGDAFASGGSNGYDHKKEGITARGAWEGVKRHFREMEQNVFVDPFTVVGIGDMAGDVFGNGMIYTDKIKLLGAFNHLHIFLDPNPDPETSFQERVRLFELPRSSWEDYNPDLISEGGGIHSRYAKEIKLTPQVQAMLGTKEEVLSGEAIIRALLRAEVDLLWNGGIGTYVRASEERDREVGDSSNDSVRITATELRCKVVGEGGNQGFTQLGRIEYARLGGRINTDAIDNSAGVDMSDHEVNIKILLQGLVDTGRLSGIERNETLAAMTDEVSELVLKDNYWQTLSLSLAQSRSVEELDLFSSLLDYLEEKGGLNREVEFLPDKRLILERERLGEGLTRPELSILLAYTKMGIFRRILETELPEEAAFQDYLSDYFPTLIQEKFPLEIMTHQLRREIIATQFTNLVVDVLGITFVHRTIRDTGASPVQVIRAALTAFEIIGMRDLLRRLKTEFADLSTEAHYYAVSIWVRSMENVVNWILLSDVNSGDLPEFIETYRSRLNEFMGLLQSQAPKSQVGRYERFLNRALERGCGQELSEIVASFLFVPGGLGVVTCSLRTGWSLEEAMQNFYRVGELFHTGKLREILRNMEFSDTWENIAAFGLINDLRQIQVRLSSYEWSQDCMDTNVVKRFLTVYSGIKENDEFSLASLAVLARMLDEIAYDQPRVRGLEQSLIEQNG